MTKLTDQEIRIKLAEEMGYRPYPDADTPCWWSPDGLTIHTLTDEFPHLSQLPDPLNDANDCEAVIKHLNGLGHHVMIDLNTDGTVLVSVYDAGEPFDFPNPDWTGDDYKRGVCELALKVIEDPVVTDTTGGTYLYGDDMEKALEDKP